MSETGSQCVPSLPTGFSVGTAAERGGSQDGALSAPGLRRDRAAEHQRVAWLAKALEADVIPRLVLARHAMAATARPDEEAGASPTEDEIAALAGIVMQGDVLAAGAFIGTLRGRNLTLPRIYLELLAPTARLLGDLWAADRCDFTSVTIGLCCLQQLVLENSHAFEPRPGRRSAERRILLAPAPGEQHSFGLLLVGEFFRRQGWDVSSGTGASGRELVATVRKQWFSMIGFSLASDSRIETLASLIREVRRATRNPQLGILVGGRAFVERPELAALVGADATAADGQQAVLKAETLLALLVQET